MLSVIDYMESVKALVKQLFDRIQLEQTNVKKALANIDVWANQELFERKDGKKENLIQLDDYTERVQKRYDQVRQSARELEHVVQQNYKLFANIPLDEDLSDVNMYSATTKL